jgi:DNA-binding MarR family transcriptional regulator
MIPLKKQLTLPAKQYYEKHLAIVNVFLPVTLTPKEIEVLAAFMSLEGSIAIDRFGTSARKLVREELSISSGGLGNYLKSLKDKGFITETPDSDFNILPLLHPAEGKQGYMFQLNKENV